MLKKKLTLYILFILIISILIGCTTTDEYDELTRYFKVSIETEGNGTVEEYPAKSLYTRGSQVELKAVPDNGWQFKGWQGELNSKDNPVVITVDGNVNIKATFSYDENATFELSTNSTDGGTVTIDPEGGSYKNGTEVTLTAQPEEGWVFVSWSGDIGNISETEKANPTLSVIMDRDKTITANFMDENSTGNDDDKLFADPNLEMVVRNKINKLTDPLTPEDVSEIITLDASHETIESLDGIQYLTALTDLDLEVNNISDVSYLASLNNLVTLNLSSNSISDVRPLADLDNLEVLYLNENQISKISPVEWLGDSKLRVLYMNQNSIAGIIPLEEISTLEELYLNNNSISDLGPLKSLTNLRILELKNNAVDTINKADIEPLVNLEELNLSGNNLSDISNLTWLWYANIHTLDLSYNDIAEIGSLQGFTLLTDLNLEGNRISDVDVFSDMANIEKLNLNYNQIQVINNMHDGVKTYNLERLELKGNQIINIEILVDFINLLEVDITENPPLYQDGSLSITESIIQQLIDRGVNVIHD